MSETDAPVRYCAVVQLDRSSTLQRISAIAPAIVKMIERWSKGEMEQLSRSNDGQTFGYLFRSTKPLGMMQAEFAATAATHNKDAIIIFAAGKDVVASEGFTRAGTWLQRH